MGSAALIEKTRFLEALDSADNAARWDPTWCKAEYRRLKALMALGRKEEALATSIRFNMLKETEEIAKAEGDLQPASCVEQQAVEVQVQPADVPNCKNTNCKNTDCKTTQGQPASMFQRVSTSLGCAGC